MESYGHSSSFTEDHTCVLSHLSCAGLFVTPWTVAHYAPLSMGFSKKEYWSGLPCPLQGSSRTHPLPENVSFPNLSPPSPAL